MSTTHEPGTVAMIRQVDAESERRALRVGNIGWHLRPCTDDEDQTGRSFVLDGQVADVRPLVVLDLTDGSTRSLPFVLRRLADREQSEDSHPGRLLAVTADLRALADQIEAQTKPPRIPEPGLWGVVEADANPEHRSQLTGVKRWVRIEAGWCSSDDVDTVSWDTLIDPTLIREGVES